MTTTKTVRVLTRYKACANAHIFSMEKELPYEEAIWRRATRFGMDQSRDWGPIHLIRLPKHIEKSMIARQSARSDSCPYRKHDRLKELEVEEVNSPAMSF